MLVGKKSQISGKYQVIDLNVTEEQMRRYDKNEELLQDIFPDLSLPEREFLKSGITPKEWTDTFGEDDEDSMSRDWQTGKDYFDDDRFIDENER